MLLNSRGGRSASPSLGRTCTPSRSPCVRRAMRAARRMSTSPPGAPVSATTTRSRVSHAAVDAVVLEVLLQRLVDLVGDPQERELAQRREVADPEVVGERRRRRGRPGRCCRAPSAGGAPPASCRPARPARRSARLVGDRLLLLHAGDALDDVVHRLEVLDVERRDHVDPGVEQLLDVLPALLVPRARGRWCARARRRAPRSGFRARIASTSISSNSRPRYSTVRRGITSRSPICACGVRPAVGLDEAGDDIGAPLVHAAGPRSASRTSCPRPAPPPGRCAASRVAMTTAYEVISASGRLGRGRG